MENKDFIPSMVNVFLIVLISVLNHTLVLFLCNKQDALARFIQLFHRIQHRAGLRNKKFFDFQVKSPLGKVGVRK